MELFKVDELIQDILNECQDGTLNEKQCKHLRLEVVRMIQFDASFEGGLLRDTIRYIEEKYPKVTLWEEHQGELPDKSTITKETFAEQRQELKENFSHKRVDWLEQAGSTLYAKANPAENSEKSKERESGVESPKKSQNQNNQQTTSKQSTVASEKQSSNIPILLAAVIAVVGLVYLLFQR